MILVGTLLHGDAGARQPGCEPTPGTGASGWVEHLIDASDGCQVDLGGRDGADGVDVADFDGDGDLDAVTGWEESGEIIVALNPGAGSPGPWDLAQPWTKLNVDGGDRKQGLEDAVFVDFQRDGLPEVVSAAEGDVREVFLSGVSPAGANRSAAASWKARDMPGDGKFYMRVQSGDVDQDGDIDIVVGSKDSTTKLRAHIDGGIWWYENPGDWTPDEGVGGWSRHRIAGDVVWVMEMTLEDMDGDGDLDVLYNDRSRVAWMRNPRAEGDNVENPDKWKKRIIERAGAITGGRGAPYRWSHYTNMDSDPAKELVVATNYDFDRGVVARWFDNDRVDTDPTDENDTRWSAFEVAVDQIPFEVGQELPFDQDEEGTQTSKAVVAAELDGDGRIDLVLTARGGENGETGHGVGLYRLSYDPSLSGPPRCARCSGDSTQHWIYAPIGPSYSPNVKYDNLKLVDADEDGDLDIFTVEENVDGKGLGLVAYENVVAPVANDDSDFSWTGEPVVFDVAWNDVDANLDRCSAVPTSAPAMGGTATVVGCGTIEFTPNPLLAGHTDSFTYRICDTDPKSPCDTATVQLVVANNLSLSAPTNGGFEITNGTDDVQHVPAGSADLQGWTITGGIDVVQSGVWPADEGSKSVDLSGDSGEAGAIQQDVATTPGEAYLLRFALSGNPALMGGPRTVVVTISSGATTVSTQTFTTFIASIGTVPPWVERQLAFVAPGSSVRVRFSTPDSSGAGPVVDDVVLLLSEGGGITANDDVISMQPRVANFLDVLANDTSTNPIDPASVEVTNVGFGMSNCLITESGSFGEPPTNLGDGRFELIPRIPCAFGSVFFNYRVCNQAGFCDTALVTVQNPLDTPEPPIAQDDSFDASLDDLASAFVFANLELNDLDANCVSGFHCTGEAITIVEPPLYGTILQTYPNFYRLDPEAALPPTPFDETFRYEICDFDGLCSQAQATIHVVATPVPVAAPACDDGLDGDGDGLVDFPHDPGCPATFSHPENPECDDGIDNDGEGLTDFDDAKCNPSWPYWEHRPTCGLGAELALALPVLAALRRRARSARAARAQLSLFD